MFQISSIHSSFQSSTLEAFKRSSRVIQALALVLMLFMDNPVAKGQVCPCGNMTTAREHMAAVVVHDPITVYRGFVFGGLDASGNVLSTGEILGGSPLTCLTPWGSFALPGPLFKASAVYSTVARKIYLIGGNNGAVDLSTVWEFDPNTLLWTAKAPMAVARSAAGATEINGKIYVVGGKSGGATLASLEEYDPLTNTWVTRAPMPTARHGLEFQPSGYSPFPFPFTHGFALGGKTAAGIHLAVNERYDPLTNTWTTMAAMPVPLAWFGGWRYYEPTAALIGTHGGESASGPVASMSVYNPTTNSWAPPFSGFLMSCAPISGHEVFQTGDPTDLVFGTMSFGGANLGGVTRQISFHGGWAVLDNGDLQAWADESRGSFQLGWEYSGEEPLASVYLQVQGEDGAFQDVESQSICISNCISGISNLPSGTCQGEDCRLRFVGTLQDGIEVVSNVVEIGSGQMQRPRFIQNGPNLRIDMPDGMAGDYTLSTAWGSVLQFGHILEGGSCSISLEESSGGIYFIRVLASTGLFSAKLYR